MISQFSQAINDSWFTIDKKNVLNLLAKSVLNPLELKVAASETETAIQKKVYRSGKTALIISNEERKDIIKIAKSQEKEKEAWENRIASKI